MTKIIEFPLNTLAYMRRNERRQQAAITRQPPAACRETLARKTDAPIVGDYVMHTGGRFAGQVGHIVDVHISPATRSICRYLVSFNGQRAWLCSGDMRQVTRAHQIVSGAMQGA